MSAAAGRLVPRQDRAMEAIASPGLTHFSEEAALVARRLVNSGRGEHALRLGRAAFQCGQLPVAEAIARAALDAGHHVAALYYLLAGVARSSGRLELAADTARVGLALDPAPAAARSDLAVIWLELGRPDEAVAVLEAIPREDRDRKTRERLGLAYALAGKRAMARRIFNGLVADDPSDKLAHAALVRLKPMALGEVLDALENQLEGPLKVVFARLRAGPATEAELRQLLRSTGFNRVFLRALIRELAEVTTPDTLPLVVVTGDRIRLDLGTLDVEVRAEESLVAQRDGCAEAAQLNNCRQSEGEA